MARKTKGIARMRAALRLALTPLLGVWTDKEIARVYGIHVATVYGWRDRAGIKPAPPPPLGTPRTRGDALRAAILDALWTRQGSTSGEVHERVERNLGRATQRQVIRVLQAHVAAGRVTRETDHYGVPRYRRVE